MKGIATKRSTAFMICFFSLAPFAVWRRYFYCYCLYPFLLVLCPQMLVAQKNDESFPFHHVEYIGAKQGLNGTAVFWITQDKKGFLWVLTDIALNRYDGYSFQSWSYNANDTNSISADFHAGLKEDRFGNLWFSSESSGLYSFDPAHEKFTNYRHQPGIENSLLDDLTYPVAGDDPDGIWVFSGTGLNMFNVSTRSFTNFRWDDLIRKGLDIGWIGNVAQENIFPSGDHEKKFYIVGIKGDIPAISSFDPATGKITNYSGLSVKEAFSCIKNAPYCWIEPGFKETIWMGSTDGGIYGFNMPKEKFVKVPITHPCKSSTHFEGFYSVLEDHAGNLWTTNDNNEIVYYNTERKKFYFFPIQKKFSQYGGMFSFIYEDRNHKIWIANLDGLITIDTDQKNIYSIQHDKADPYSISGDQVWVINRLANKLFVGSQRCQEFDKNKNQFREPDFLRKLNTFRTYSVEPDKKGLTWLMGSYGIIRYDPVSNTAIQIDRFKTDSGDIDVGVTNGLAEDKKGRHWTSNSQGLCSFDPVSFKAKIYSIFGPSDVDLPFFGEMFMDSSGVIYVQSIGNGFVTFNTNNERFKVYKHDPSDPGSVRQELAFNFIQTKNGLIWFGTSGGGIGVFNPTSERFRAFTTEDGLIHNFVVSLVLDKKGEFWAGTSGGLSCFTPPEDPFAPGCRIRFRNYDVSDGLPSNVFMQASSFCDADGTLFFGTGFAGLVYFHPDSLKNNEFIPPVYVTGLSVNNNAISLKDSNKILERAIDYTRGIVLNHTQNTLSLSFTALNYTYPEKNKYAYKLEPFDKDWINTDASQRFANYTNLDPGEYIFKVRGSNNDGIWNNTPTELKIIINPPFWQTGWFRTLIFITAAFILYAIYRYRVQQVVRLQTIRNNIAGDLHDDIGSTLNSISIYSEIAKQQAQKEIPALDVIGQNSRKIVESMSDIVWTINPANDPFEKVIVRMRSFAYELLKAKQIEYTFEAEEKLNSVSLPMQVRKNFYLIFKEAITNLVKYSGASRVLVSIYWQNKNIVLEIRDNGKGIPVNHETQGNGLMNMKRRAEEIQARLNITSGNGSGTSIELVLRT